jgi:hypothetical protein
VAIAKDLKLDKNPDILLVEILKRGIKEALKENYPFYKDIMDKIVWETWRRNQIEFKRRKVGKTGRRIMGHLKIIT